MLQGGGYLVFELFSVYRLPSTSRACWITTLDHEVRDNAVEYEVIEVVALGKSREVLARLGSVVIVEFDDNGALGERLVFVSFQRYSVPYNCSIESNVCSHGVCLKRGCLRTVMAALSIESDIHRTLHGPSQPHLSATARVDDDSRPTLTIITEEYQHPNHHGRLAVGVAPAFKAIAAR